MDADVDLSSGYTMRNIQTSWILAQTSVFLKATHSLPRSPNEEEADLSHTFSSSSHQNKQLHLYRVFLGQPANNRIWLPIPIDTPK